MTKYALINYTNTVVNISEWDGKTAWNPDNGITAIPNNTANIGDKWNGINIAVDAVLPIP